MKMKVTPAKLIAAVFAVVTVVVTVAEASVAGELPSSGPYDRQVAEQAAKLADASAHVRLRAAVRRQAALSRGWCGGRTAVASLLTQLEDADWLGWHARRRRSR